MGSGDPWYDMPAGGISLKNKKNSYQKKESNVSVLKSPKKGEISGNLRESASNTNEVAKET